MTSNEPLSPPLMSTSPCPRILVYLTHTVLFLLATAAGAALTYSLQPPKPPPSQMLYELSYFSWKAPITEFDTSRDLFDLSGYLTKEGIRGPQILGTEELTSVGKRSSSTAAYLPSPMTNRMLRDEYTLNVDGEERGGKIFTKLKFTMGDVVWTCPVELAANEVRLIPLDIGAKHGRRFSYALVRVKSINPPTVGAMSNVGAASGRP